MNRFRILLLSGLIVLTGHSFAQTCFELGSSQDTQNWEIGGKEKSRKFLANRWQELAQKKGIPLIATTDGAFGQKLVFVGPYQTSKYAKDNFVTQSELHDYCEFGYQSVSFIPVNLQTAKLDSAHLGSAWSYAVTPDGFIKISVH
jgi:hypothetical protein